YCTGAFYCQFGVWWFLTIGCCRPFEAGTAFPPLRGYKSAPKPGVRHLNWTQVSMNTNILMSGISMPRIPDATAPRRELHIRDDDEKIIDDAIEELDRSSLKTDDLYEVFSDWQTKKTLTSKRIFVSTSIIVAAAAWIGIDYTELT